MLTFISDLLVLLAAFPVIVSDWLSSWSGVFLAAEGGLEGWEVKDVENWVTILSTTATDNNNNNNNWLDLHSAFLDTQSAPKQRGDLTNHQCVAPTWAPTRVMKDVPQQQENSYLQDWSVTNNRRKTKSPKNMKTGKKKCLHLSQGLRWF